MISIVYKDEQTTVYCADTKDIFKPYPAKDVILKNAQLEKFVLKTGKKGKTAFQIIVAAATDITIKDVSAEGLCCFATQGRDIFGNCFSQEMPVYAGKPWALWCQFDGESVNSNTLDIKIESADGKVISFEIALNHSDEFNSSLYDSDSFARLEWLNSSEGTEKTLIEGFEPVRLSERTIKILGRDIIVSEKGSIENIGTYFIGNNSEISDKSREILNAPMEYQVFEDGKLLDFETINFVINQDDDISCTWKSSNVCGGISLIVEGRAEFDGSVQLEAKIHGCEGKNLSVRFEHSPSLEFSKYFMGLGKIGSKMPENHTWKWDETKHQDAMWCGSINGGVYLRPTSEDTCRPFVNIYFHHSQNHIPANWYNDGKGYFSLKNEDFPVLFYDTGDFIAKDNIQFGVNIMISPFKKTSVKKHWNTHYYHKNFNMDYTEADVKDAVANGCTHINLHHGNDTLPFLNYPMYDIKPLKELADLAHENGLGFKPYYTVRELTTRLPELFAFRSLRDEIFPRPTYSQGGISWQNGVDEYLTENFGEEVIPAWKHTFHGGKYDGTTDPTIITNPSGRISNFYIGSLAWLIQNVGIDGLYIDDVGYDKNILRRVRRVFDKYNPGANIDFHTWNQFEDEHGAGFAHNSLIYMDLFPYLDSLWVGESFDYDNNSAEYLLTEVSGLPFGIMSEMLEGDCNVWRGMLFGMTSRYPYYQYYSGPSPVPVWQLRKEFDNAEMIGFWEDEKPVWCDNDNVLCTTYYEHEANRMLCCIANFAPTDAQFSLKGCLEGRRVFAPYIKDIQEKTNIDIKDKITLSPKGGIMLIVE